MADTVHSLHRSSVLSGPSDELSGGKGGCGGGLVEREDSELLLTQAAVDAMPPRKSLVRRPSVVQFAEMQEAAASFAREASQQMPAEQSAKPKTKFQVTHLVLDLTNILNKTRQIASSQFLVSLPLSHNSAK